MFTTAVDATPALANAEIRLQSEICMIIIVDLNSATVYWEYKIRSFLRAISSGKYIALSKYTSRPCSSLVSAESTEAMQINWLAQGHNILKQPECDPSIAVFRNRNLTNMTNILLFGGNLSCCTELPPISHP